MIQDKRASYLHEVGNMQARLEGRWRRNRIINTVLRFVAVAGAALVATLLNTQAPKEISAIISILVVIATVTSNLSRFDQRSHINRLTAVAMEKEMRFYNLKTGVYKGVDEEKAFDHFMETIEQLKEERIKKVMTIETSAPNSIEQN